MHQFRHDFTPKVGSDTVRIEDDLVTPDQDGLFLSMGRSAVVLSAEDAETLRDTLCQRYGLPATTTATYGNGHAVPIEELDAFLGRTPAPEPEPTPCTSVLDKEGDWWVLNPETGFYYLPTWGESAEEADTTLEDIAEDFGIDRGVPTPAPTSEPAPTFTPGDVVRFAPRGTAPYVADRGALAEVRGYDDDFEGFVRVEWLRYDPRHNGQRDGHYYPADFELVRPASWSPGPPRPRARRVRIVRPFGHIVHGTTATVEGDDVLVGWLRVRWDRDHPAYTPDLRDGLYRANRFEEIA